MNKKKDRKQERLLANQQNLGKKGIAHTDQKKEKTIYTQEKVSDMIKWMTLGREFLQ